MLPRLYNICEDPDVIIADCWDRDWNIGFRRNLGLEEQEEWNLFLSITHGVSLDDQVDKVVWALEKNKCFTTKSLYRLLTFQGVRCNSSDLIWKANIPLKVKIFLWQMRHDRLQTNACLSRKGNKRSDRCCLCGKVEEVDHIFFNCSYARYAWCVIRDAFGWDRCPTSVSEFWCTWLPAKLTIPKKLGIFCFAGITWALWKCRNKMTIEKKFSSTTDALLSGLSLLQKWCLLLKEPEKEKMARMIPMIIAQLKEVDRKPLEVISDVMEL